MLALDLFNTKYERQLHEGAVDDLEARRIDTLNDRMQDLLARAREPAYKKNPQAMAALKKQFQQVKDERDSYYKIREGGIPGNVPVEKIPGKEELLKGQGRTYYEAQKKSSEPSLYQRLDRLKVQARREFPQVNSDQEALLLKILDKEAHDDRLNRQVDARQDAELRKNFALDREQEDEIEDLQTQAGVNESDYKDDWYDEEDQETELRSGDYVRDTQDGELGEIFRMQGDPYERRVRILDRDGKGWYIEPSRLTRVDPQDPDVQRYFGKQRRRDMDEGKADYNFDAEDLKRLERIRDLPTLKTQALALISKPSAKPMKPEKVEWFKNALDSMNSPIKVIKLMYDLLLSGEGHAVVGSKSSMNPNSYRQRFGEQGVAEAEKKGLYYYVNKRKKAGTSRDASSPKAPTAQAWKDAAKTAKKEDVAEGLKSGEYHIHTVYFKDGTKKRVRVTSDEFDVADYYTKRGQAVDRVDYDFQIHSDMSEARPVTASADITASAKKLWQYIGRNLEDLASNADFDAERNELYINDRLNNLFTTPNGQPVKVAFDMSSGVDFDKGILYIPIGTIWKYRGMYTAERFVNDVVQALGKPGVAEEKTRLDPKCWSGKKIGTPKTKVKGGVRVNNCVPAESVNEDQDSSGVERAILNRIMVAHTDLLMKFGPDKVMQAAEEVAYNVGDVDEIGTSDVSAYVQQVKQILGAV